MMFSVQREEELVKALRDEERQLDRWADESLQGGWSTHQVEPMRKRAKDIRETLWRCGYGP